MKVLIIILSIVALACTRKAQTIETKKGGKKAATEQESEKGEFDEKDNSTNSKPTPKPLPNPEEPKTPEPKVDPKDALNLTLSSGKQVAVDWDSKKSKVKALKATLKKNGTKEKPAPESQFTMEELHKLMTEKKTKDVIGKVITISDAPTPSDIVPAQSGKGIFTAKSFTISVKCSSEDFQKPSTIENSIGVKGKLVKAEQTELGFSGTARFEVELQDCKYL